MNNELNWVKIIDEIDPELIENADEDAPGLPASSARRSPRRVKNLGRAVVIAAAVVLVLFSVLMFNAEVRAAVLGFFIKWDDEGYARVHYDRTDSGNVSVDIGSVTIGYIPEGLIMRESSDQVLDGKMRVIHLLKEGDAGVSEEEMQNGLSPQVLIWINRTSEFDWGYKEKAYNMTYRSTINGLDALIIDNETENVFTKGGSILFGDENITVRIVGNGIYLDEIIKVAEGVSW